jgi:hypothetical protein
MESSSTKTSLPGFHHAAAALDHEAGEPHMGLEVLVVRGGDHLGLDGALEIGDFLGRSSISSTITCTSGMVGGDGVGDLLEDGGLARARRRHNQPAGALCQGA